MDKIKERFENFRGKPIKSQIAALLPYFITTFLLSRVSELYRLCNGNLAKFIKNIAYIYKTFPRFTAKDLLFGLTAGISIIWLCKWYDKLHGKNERLGEEYGSARWGTPEDIGPFIDKDPYYNIILSQTENFL